jgi:predicted Zn-dependent protease
LAPGDTCAACAQSNVFRLVHREIVLLVLLFLGAAALYLGTRAFASNNLAMKMKVGRFWYQEGQRQLRSGHADLAVAAFRKASVNDHDNRVYARLLAQALVMDGRDSEARELLLQDREAAPENPQINLELARIAVKQHDTPEVVRYYHNALYGIWTGEEVDAQRQAVRRELIQYLFAQHAKDLALGEILAFAGRLPNTVAANSELGALFLQAGDAHRALESFRAVLKAQPHNQAALQGAGIASFELRNYLQSQHYLTAAAPTDSQAKATLKIATLAVEHDPAEPRLSYAERRQRITQDFEHVTELLQQCSDKSQQNQKPPAAPLNGPPPAAGAQTPQSLLARQDEIRKSLANAGRHEDPDAIFRALDYVYQVENEVAKTCGPLSDLDYALFLISQKSKGGEQ